MKIYGTKLGSMILPIVNNYILIAQGLNMLTTGYGKEEFGEEAIYRYILPLSLSIGILFNILFNENG